MFTSRFCDFWWLTVSESIYPDVLFVPDLFILNRVHHAGSLAHRASMLFCSPSTQKMCGPPRTDLNNQDGQKRDIGTRTKLIINWGYLSLVWNNGNNVIFRFCPDNQPSSLSPSCGLKKSLFFLPSIPLKIFSSCFEKICDLSHEKSFIVIDADVSENSVHRFFFILSNRRYSSLS